MPETEGTLTLDDLVRGLTSYGGKYHALDFVAKNVRELVEASRRRALAGGLRAVGPNLFMFERNGVPYQLALHRSGIGRLSQARAAGGLTDDQVALGTLGAAIGAMSSREFPAMVLGFLIGAAFGTGPEAPRRVVSLRYDPDAHRWVAYDGPMARWIRERSSTADAELGAPVPAGARGVS